MDVAKENLGCYKFDLIHKLDYSLIVFLFLNYFYRSGNGDGRTRCRTFGANVYALNHLSYESFISSSQYKGIRV